MSISENNCSNSSKPKCDPGWNDPPLFSYENIYKSCNKPKTILNKRIAFPIKRDDGLSNNSTQRMNPSMPPTEAISLPPPIGPLTVNSKQTPSSETTNNSNIQQSLESRHQETLACVLENFNYVFSKCDFKNIKKSDEIHKRLEIMKKMWQDGKLNDDIQNKMILLAESLKNDDYESANHIQVSLMVDHVALCSSWMVGIRHLIQQVQSTKK